MGGENGDKTVAFAHALTGPYVNGTLVATHNASGSSCYNAVHIAHLDLSNGTIFFACTYTSMWSNNKTLGANLWSTVSIPQPTEIDHSNTPIYTMHLCPFGCTHVLFRIYDRSTLTPVFNI